MMAELGDPHGSAVAGTNLIHMPKEFTVPDSCGLARVQHTPHEVHMPGFHCLCLLCEGRYWAQAYDSTTRCLNMSFLTF